MKNNIKNRALEEGRYILKTGKTIREIAKVYGISKSTVHKDLKERLKDIDIDLYDEVQKIIKYHTETRHIKGGESTKKKYLKVKYNV